MALTETTRIAVIGAGDLGAAIIAALIARGGIAPERIVAVTASGTAPRLADWPALTVARDPARAAAAADITLLAVPPAAAAGLSLGTPPGPVLSVMAGVTLAGLERIAGHGRVIRAMSSPAAARGLAFSPYIAGPGATPADAALAHALLAACGPAEPVPDENQIDLFTALTGPVPGFVAAFAAMLADWAAARGVAPGLADRAVRQLVRAAGEVMATTAPTPAERVAEMVDYAGTTAAGLNHLATTTMAADLARALDASVEKARAIAAGPDA